MEIVRERLVGSLASYKPQEDDGSRASVALILRERLGCQVSDSAEAVEAAFILRSINPNDRWSGHVALPGGRQQPGEDDVQTAVRETLEEVGWDLSPAGGAFQLIGRLDDRRLAVTAPTICILAFAQVVAATPPVQLAPSEVAAVAWCPLSALTQGPESVTPLERDLEFALREAGRLPRLASRVVGPSAMLFASVALPVTEVHTSSPGLDARERFVLWGLTLDILTDLLVRVGLRQDSLQLRTNVLGRWPIEQTCRSQWHSLAVALVKYASNDVLGHGLVSSQCARRLLEVEAWTSIGGALAAVLAGVVGRIVRRRQSLSKL